MRGGKLALAVVIASLIFPFLGRAAPIPVPRDYARAQAAARGWTGSQWLALDAIVRPESGWNPCARYPAMSDCRYAGSNSCGVPQANPCPLAWRGRLWSTRFAQVRWLLDYVRGRYGDPLAALAFRRTHGWF